MQLSLLSLIQETLKSGFAGTDDTDTDSNTEQINSEGSGVIYKNGDDAYLVTNTHVISGAKKVDIRLADGTKYQVKLLVPIPILILQ